MGRFLKIALLWTSYSRNKHLRRLFILTSSQVRDQKMRHFEAVLLEVEMWYLEAVPRDESSGCYFISMQKNKLLCHCIGVKITVYKKFLHPRAAVLNKYPSATKQEWWAGQSSCHFTGGKTCIHASTGLFDNATRQFWQWSNRPSRRSILQGNWRRTGQILFLAAPENIRPTSTDTATDGILYKPWGSEALDTGRVLGVRDVQPTLVSASQCVNTHCVGLLPSLVFAYGVLQNNYIARQATNETLLDPLTWDEFLRFTSIPLLFETTQEVPWQRFWSNETPPDIFSGSPFCLHACMSRSF